MEKNTNFHIKLLLCTALCMGQSFAVVSLGTALTTNAQSAGIDPVTGNFYVGTVAGAGNSPIAKFTRYTSDGTALSMTNILTGVTANGSNAVLTDLGISNISIANSSGRSRIGCITSGLPQQILVVQDNAGTITAGQMAALVQSGAAANGVIHGNLAVTPNLVFAGVGTGATTWLDASCVLAVHIINGTTMVPAAAAATIAVLRTLADGTFALGTDLTDGNTGDSPRLYWDNHLERLFLANDFVEIATNAGDVARNLAVYSVDSLTTPTAITRQAIKTNENQGWQSGAADATRNIVGIGGTAANGYSAVTPVTGVQMTCTALTTMLTEAGHSYLIHGGGQTTTGAGTVFRNNVVYALPLVTKGYTNQGSLAKVDSIDFSIRADNAATDLYNQASTPAIVGAGILPMVATEARNITLQAIGHTVYVFTNDVTDATNENGVFYSTAMFDHNGKIKEWTRWEKAAPSALGTFLPGFENVSGDLLTGAVDPVTGKIWGVPGAALTQVRSTSWTKSTTTSELAQAVNAQLTTGCYAMHSIGRSTNNFGNVATASLAAFGGIGKVCFARTGIKTASYTGIQTGQALASYATGAGFAVTTLPNANEKVNCLSYFRGLTADGATGYFLAGTDSGLYIFTTAADAGGTPATDLDTLNTDYFAATCVWKAFTGTADQTGVTKVTGSVKKIVSRGDSATVTNCAYVLAQDTGTDGTIRDSLYRLQSATTSAAIVIELIAQSGVDGTQSKLANAGRFLDFVIVQGGTGATGEEVILVTQAGLFQSRVIGDAKGAAGAAIDTAEEFWWAEVGQKPGNTYTATYPFAFAYAQQTAANCTSFTTIHHVDGSDRRLQTFGYNAFNRWGSFGTTLNDADTTENIGLPVRKISAAMQNTSSTSTFLRLNRIIQYWSDGARRFMITKPADGSDTESLVALPYRVGSTEWNLTDPVTAITNTVISGVTHFNCIEMLPHGVLAVGTDTGIITLE